MTPSQRSYINALANRVAAGDPVAVMTGQTLFGIPSGRMGWVQHPVFLAAQRIFPVLQSQVGPKYSGQLATIPQKYQGVYLLPIAGFDKRSYWWNGGSWLPGYAPSAPQVQRIQVQPIPSPPPPPPPVVVRPVYTRPAPVPPPPPPAPVVMVPMLPPGAVQRARALVFQARRGSPGAIQKMQSVRAAAQSGDPRAQAFYGLVRQFISETSAG